MALGIKDYIDRSCENWLLIIEDHYGKHFIQGKFNGIIIGQHYLESKDADKTKKNILAKCTKEIIFGNGITLFMKDKVSNDE